MLRYDRVVIPLHACYKEKFLRIFCISDIHVEYEINRRWLNNLSQHDYKNDLLILAGDITNNLMLLEKILGEIRNRFLEVCFVPGNHELWVQRDKSINSLEKLSLIQQISSNSGVLMEPFENHYFYIVPLFGWYDYSFGPPSDEILTTWMDYWACEWPANFDQKSIAKYFLDKNETYFKKTNKYIISFSHFLPRIDLMPFFIPPNKRYLYPVLGSFLLEEQIRKLGSSIHIYGHSHVNRRVYKDNVLYINNAFGYPHETMIARKELICVMEL